jgi:hypothetical protein
MPLLDEVNIRTKLFDDEIWVNVKDLSDFLFKSVKDFSDDIFKSSLEKPLNPSEAMLFKGLAEGMLNVVALLSQGGMEAEINTKINTVEDFFNNIQGK